MEYEFEDDQRDEDRRKQMAQEQPRTSSLVDTTDCLEAVGVIRCWKNILFIIILLSMILLLGALAAVDLKWVRAEEAITMINPPAELVTAAEANEAGTVEKARIREAASRISLFRKKPAEPSTPAIQPAAEPNQPRQVAFAVRFELTLTHIISTVRLLNFILIPGALLYCLTMLFALKVSMIGRLGGINHITRAFFVSLLFVVLLLPWQVLLAPVFAGAMFTPGELLVACQAEKTRIASISFYLRFVGYWLLVIVLLLISQMRSMRWARATLRRLEVI
jgi:hypothetical protein